MIERYRQGDADFLGYQIYVEISGVFNMFYLLM